MPSLLHRAALVAGKPVYQDLQLKEKDALRKGHLKLIRAICKKSNSLTMLSKTGFTKATEAGWNLCSLFRIKACCYRYKSRCCCCEEEALVCPPRRSSSHRCCLYSLPCIVEHKFGREKAIGLNTFAVMKSGAKNIDITRNHGPISSQKSQKIMNDYNAMVNSEPREDLDGHELYPKALYTICSGLPHGRLPIGNGAVNKAEVIAAGKATTVRPSNSTSNQNLVRENVQLHRENFQLHRQLQVHQRLIKLLYEKIDEEPPTDEDLMSPTNIQRTGSSHAGSQPDPENHADENTQGNNMDCELNFGCDGNSSGSNGRANIP